MRILVVEDEGLVSMAIEDMLEDLGHIVAAVASRLHAALEQARTEEIDFALLDINLHGELSFEVADALKERGVPFAFLTGYGVAGLPARLAGEKVLQKPVSSQELSRLLADRQAMRE